MAKDFSKYGSFPLGLRNNNPGNLRYNANIQWQGQIGQNKGFAVFRDVAYGIRAYGMDLTHDIKKGANTLEKLIYQFAPPSENNTEAYIINVSRISGIPRNQILAPNIDTLARVARGMFSVELGASFAQNLSDKDIREGLLMISASAGLGSSSNSGTLPIIIVIGLLSLLFIK
jgi:hypothetical protein